MAVRLIAFDLDGTLLNSQKVISEETYTAMEEAAAKGGIWYPARVDYIKWFLMW